MQAMKLWLVEIRLKDWKPDFSALPSRVLGYEEVEALDEYSARHTGFDQFKRRATYEPRLKEKLSQLGLTHLDYCAPDAVSL